MGQSTCDRSDSFRCEWPFGNWVVRGCPGGECERAHHSPHPNLSATMCEPSDPVENWLRKQDVRQRDLLRPETRNIFLKVMILTAMSSDLPGDSFDNSQMTPSSAIPPRHVPRKKPSKKRLAAVVSAVLVVVLVLAAFLFPGSPLLSHVQCESEFIAVGLNVFATFGILNVPYGGNGTLRVAVPSWGIWSQYSSNSSYPVSGTTYLTEYNVSSLRNTSVIGIGTSHTCGSQFEVHPVLSQRVEGGFAGAALSNATSDVNESTISYVGFSPAIYGVEGINPTTRYFNGFTTANMPNITTCGSSTSVVESTTSDYLTMRFAFNDSGTIRYVPYDLRINVDTFTYTFPANFGTWEIDNLSAPGGPGGGWAFAYYPCP